MDPVTQGALGSVFALCKAQKKEITAAIWLGALSGMAPDLDILIRSSEDPMVYFEFHRHFTHSLIFIPLGAFICHFVLFRFFKRFAPNMSWKSGYLYCLLGYASHGILDACTSYGTMLLWPFSEARIAWDVVSIIDPAFTLPIIAMIVLARWKQTARWGIAALAFAIVFMGFAHTQHQRAISRLENLAVSRGHSPIRVHAKPSFANMIVYRGLYEYDGSFYVDAIRIPFWGESKIYEGSSKMRVLPEEIYPDTTSQGYKDLKKFEWFSNGFLVRDDKNPLLINDFRYSMLPNSTQELWGVLCDPDLPDAHVQSIFQRNMNPQTLDTFKKMLRGN